MGAAIVNARKGGRPKGSESLRTTRDQVLAFVKTKHAPLKLLERRLRWIEKQHDLRLAEVQAHLRDPETESVFSIPKRYRWKLDDLLECGNLLERCAMHAMPYCHPRLNAVELTGADGGPIETREYSLTDVARRLLYAMHEMGSGDSGQTIEHQPEPTEVPTP